MPERRLREDLEELHEELRQTRTLDPEARAALEGLVDDIRQVLRDQRSNDGSLIERLRESARSFEESHPTLTAAVGRVADALSNMGI